MTSSLSENDSASPPPAGSESANELRHLIDHAAHLLPTQGPIEVFVHHNTLHALEHLPFHQAVRTAWEIHGAQPYLSEVRFRELLRSGRISRTDIDAVLNKFAERADADFFVAHPEFGTREDFLKVMMLHAHHTGPATELRWVIAETDALTAFREDVDPRVRSSCLDKAGREDLADIDGSLHARYLHRLWSTCCEKIAQLPHQLAPRHLRLRDALLAATGTDTDVMVGEVLIRFTAAFLDQGYSTWQLPGRQQGFLRSFIELFGHSGNASMPWMQGVAERLRRLNQTHSSALDCIEQQLIAMGVSQVERKRFIRQTLLALPGWAGMVQQMEHAPEWIDHPAPQGSLDEFLAVRLILDEAAAEAVARESLRIQTPACHLRDELAEIATDDSDRETALSFELFQWSQLMGWLPSMIGGLDSVASLVAEFERFDSIARRRVFQDAYERHYQRSILEAVGTIAERHCNFGQPRCPSDRPRFQLCCCIDDREESFRRHLEEIEPACETFGAAGFFAVAMNYRGAADASYKPLCPAVVTPTHYVRENVGYTFAGDHRRRLETRRTLGRITHSVHAGSRSFFGGMVTSVLGSLAAFPLVARVLFPRLTSQLRRRAGNLVGPPPVTQLQLERYRETPGSHNGHIGYTLDDMVSIVRRLLEDIGLVTGFSRLVVITGHGSSSVNNPHMSAYNCGACAGKRGGPNARAFAQMANDYRVRQQLSEQGIDIPEDTWFLGAYHNTCDETVGWFDLDRMPPSHNELFETTKRIIDQAIERNAHERCRRFEAAALEITPAEAVRHVHRRSEDLSQVRPEYNHATNALCFVGRRDWSRNLFLDRRVFLTSYDPTIDDPAGTILARILAAAIPVCAGINLEYYFSTVDNVKYGSGSKLPHNLVSLLGVMEGSSSDLRTGLYHQMIEIHEPMRLMFVVETKPEIMQSILEANEAVGQLCHGQWVRLVVLHQETGTLYGLDDGEFKPIERGDAKPSHVAVSADWYGGRREHLPPAIVAASMRPNSDPPSRSNANVNGKHNTARLQRPTASPAKSSEGGERPTS